MSGDPRLKHAGMTIYSYVIPAADPGSAKKSVVLLCE